MIALVVVVSVVMVSITIALLVCLFRSGACGTCQETTTVAPTMAPIHTVQTIQLADGLKLEISDDDVRVLPS